MRDSERGILEGEGDSRERGTTGRGGYWRDTNLLSLQIRVEM